LTRPPVTAIAEARLGEATSTSTELVTGHRDVKRENKKRVSCVMYKGERHMYCTKEKEKEKRKENEMKGRGGRGTKK
jgi:hypothetical protein